MMEKKNFESGPKGMDRGRSTADQGVVKPLQGKNDSGSAL